MVDGNLFVRFLDDMISTFDDLDGLDGGLGE